MENKIKPTAFLLVNTNLDACKVKGSIKKIDAIKWIANVFGPYQLVAYLVTETRKELIETIEDIRSRRYIKNLDARMVKTIPKDEELKEFTVIKSEVACLLINVDYTQEKERNVTYNLRRLKGVVFARAMWGPADIIAIVEAKDHETMRNLICDDIKMMKGVKTNTTLYGYKN